MKKIRITAALALVALLLTFLLSSCTLIIPGLDALPDSEDTSPEEEKPDNGGVKDQFEDSAVKDFEEGDISLTVAIGEEIDLTSVLPEGVIPDSWESACEGVAKVTGNKVSGIKFGKTELLAKDSRGDTVCQVTLFVEFKVANNNGYSFPKITDNTVHLVESLSMADRIVDNAVANHVSEIILDFSLFGEDFDPFVDYRGSYEFSKHVSYKKKKYENKPQVLYITITYADSSATEVSPPLGRYEYTPVTSGNAVVRDLLSEYTRRSDDYEGFYINSINRTFDVYNSEELWWAVEQGFRPVFPMENSKAELFYERAKTILREIISDGMTDTEKVIAIYEYLIHLVNYDYDTYYGSENVEESKKNTAYYLEGVFESGKAVCDGKSKAFVLLCRIEGIESLRDFGDGKDSSVGHAWNYVKLGDSWFVVDTTKGDMATEADSGMGVAFGADVELVDCIGFLLPLSCYENEYIYSGVWEHIFDEGDADAVELYFTTALYNGGGMTFDFEISSQNEMNKIISTLLSSDISDKYLLTVILDRDKYSNSTEIFDLLDKALRNVGIFNPKSVYKIFESECRGCKVLYIALFGVDGA